MNKQPNVIVFFTDQQRHDSTGVHGNPMGVTPNFDMMANEGTFCQNACTCQPVCLPARISLQTGKYASRFDTYSNAGFLPDDAPTLGHYFRDAGYHTGYIGKWHMCHDDRLKVPRSNRSGYDYWLGMNVVELDTDAYDAWLLDDDEQKVELPGYRADGFADAMIRFIQENKEKPFFLMGSFIEPHFQNTRDDYPAPTGYETQYAGNCWTPPDLQAMGGTSARHLPGYYGMIKRLDECFGRVMDSLKSMNLLENTIVVYTTDHGCHFKTRNNEYKRSCHDSSIRIPLAFSGPNFDQGGRLKEMISLVDVPPTLLDACGISVPEDMDGRSILPLVDNDKKAKQEWPTEAFVEYCDGTMGRSVRTKRWTYAITRTVPGVDPKDGWTFRESHLYDNLADPWQQENMINHESHSSVKEIMRERILKRMAEAGSPAPEIELASSDIPKGQKTISQAEAMQ